MTNALANYPIELPLKYKLCVSDFDGVQGFTEKLQMEAYISIIMKYAGISPDFNDISVELIGKTAVENLQALKDRYKLAPDLSALVEEREEIYLRSVLTTGVSANAFMVDICKGFALSGGLKPIIVSNSNYKVIQTILDYWGTRELFGEVYASDTFPNTDNELKRRKLDFILHYLPQAYNIAASDIIVFEDSVSTCQRVEEAGMGVGFVSHILNGSFYPRTGIVLGGKTVL